MNEVRSEDGYLEVVTKVPLEINKELVVSTAHIPQSLNDIMLGIQEDTEGIAGFAYDTVDGGYRIYTASLLSDDAAALRGYPEQLRPLVKLARDNDCKWLVLDCDGPSLPGFTTWDW